MKLRMLFIGPLSAVIAGITLYASGGSPAMAWTVAVTVLSAMWWISEVIPIPATSLIPLAVLPAVGVLTPNEIGESVGSPLILLMMGGFILSTAMERSGAHRRIALGMVRLTGGQSGRRLVFGFMAASAMLSMWLSNAATTLMLMPIAFAVIEEVKDDRFRVRLLLGIAYAASVGGIGTPIGTPPNLVFMAEYKRLLDTEPTFLEWMRWACPVVAVMIPVVGWWLSRGLPRNVNVQLPEVGPWRAEEIRTLAVFAVTAALWITRRQPGGGWSTAVGLPNVNDASIALTAVVVMFLIPNGKGSQLLDWPTARSIEWGTLILFGGGIAIAKAFVASGLSAELGEGIAMVGQFPMVIMVGCICLAVTFLTEVTSNTATTTILMPILAAAAVAGDVEPRMIMVPATISASFAFMLPVATPPNAIVFGAGRLTVAEMAREGLILNLLGVLVVTIVCFWVL